MEGLGLREWGNVDALAHLDMIGVRDVVVLRDGLVLARGAVELLGDLAEIVARLDGVRLVVAAGYGEPWLEVGVGRVYGLGGVPDAVQDDLGRHIGLEAAAVQERLGVSGGRIKAPASESCLRAPAGCIV